MKFIPLALIVFVLLAITYATPTAVFSPMVDDGAKYDPEKVLKQQKCILAIGDEMSEKYNFVVEWNGAKKTLQDIHAAAEKCNEAKDEACQKVQDINFEKTLRILLSQLSSILSVEDYNTIIQNIDEKCIHGGSATFQPFGSSGAYFLSFYLFIQVLAYLQR